MKPLGKAILRFRHLNSALVLLAGDLAQKLNNGEATAEYLPGLHAPLTPLAAYAKEGADAAVRAAMGKEG